MVLKIISGRRGQKDYFGDSFICRAFEDLPDELIADPLALIFGKYGGGAKKSDISMTFQADTAENLATAAPRDEKAAEVLFHSVVREFYLRENLKDVVQTCRSGLLNGDELSSHIISPCEVDEGYRRRGTACPVTRAAHFGEIVFEHDEYFPLVPVWVGHPGFILDGVTAGGLRL